MEQSKKEKIVVVPILRSIEELKRDFNATQGKRKSDDQLQFQRDKVIFEAIQKLIVEFNEYNEKMGDLIDEIKKKAVEIEKDLSQD